MKALLICVGSRGDAEPFVALADRLLQEGHSVEFFIQPELKELAPPSSPLLKIHELPFTQFDFYKFVANPTKGKDLQGRLRFVAIVADVIGELVLPHWKPVLEAAKNDCNVIVTSALARPLCFALSSKLNLPTLLIHLQPLVPTKLFPYSSNTADFVKTLLALQDSAFDASTGSEENLESYWELEKAQHEFLEERVDAMYEHMELTPKMDFATLQIILSGNDPNTFVGNSFIDTLIPKVLDAGPNVHHLGPLADHYIPKDFEPPSNVVSFLHENPKPICVGFGSMPYNQVSVLLQALQEVDRKAILVGKALEIPPENNEWAKANVLQASSLPYAWLLPQCQMMLCHGGAGVTHATLRAGIPVVISPLMGDQFFFAQLAKAKGLGARAGEMLPQATKEDFVAAIQEATACTDAAKAFGESARKSPLGVDTLKQLLEKIVADGAQTN